MSADCFDDGLGYGADDQQLTDLLRLHLGDVVL
jgi:hypothetical protein